MALSEYGRYVELLREKMFIARVLWRRFQKVSNWLADKVLRELLELGGLPLHVNLSVCIYTHIYIYNPSNPARTITTIRSIMTDVLVWTGASPTDDGGFRSHPGTDGTGVLDVWFSRESLHSTADVATPRSNQVRTHTYI